MTDPFVVAAGERSADEIIAAMEEGRRVVIQTEMLGSEHEVTLRYDGEIYYCDTPTTLHKHETAAEMRDCLTAQNYVSSG